MTMTDHQFERVLSQVIFDNPRWLGGPRICSAVNLPAFGSKKEALDFHETNAPGCHLETDEPWEPCNFCGCYHYKSTARGPGGESSGMGRFSKHKKK